MPAPITKFRLRRWYFRIRNWSHCGALPVFMSNVTYSCKHPVQAVRTRLMVRRILAARAEGRAVLDAGSGFLFWIRG